MKQIRLDEMTDRRKVQYAQSKKKAAGKISFGIYSMVAVYFVVLITCACVMPEDANELPVLGALAAIVIVIAIIGDKKYHKILDMYDVILAERVWEGRVDNLCPGEEIEFIDKNSQTLQKVFTGDTYKRFFNAGNIHVVYIARLDRWYLEKGEQ